MRNAVRLVDGLDFATGTALVWIGNGRMSPIEAFGIVF